MQPREPRTNPYLPNSNNLQNGENTSPNPLLQNYQDQVTKNHNKNQNHNQNQLSPSSSQNLDNYGENKDFSPYAGQDFSSTESVPFFPKKLILPILALLGALYLFFWIFYMIWPSVLSESSQGFSEDFSKAGWYFTFHFFVFGYLMYFWWFIVFAVLFLLAPRRASAVKSITFIFLSIWINAYFNVWGEGERPNWLNREIEMRFSCDCMYGMADMYTNISVMLWGSLVYELIINSRHTTKVGKMISIGVATFVVINIIFSRWYYGDSNIWHTFAGLLHGLVFLSLGNFLKKPFNKLCYEAINSVSPGRFALVGLSGLILLLNTIFFYAWFNPALKTDKIDNSDCFVCTREENYNIRVETARWLALTNMFFGIAVGILIINPRYDGPNDFMIENHLSLNGGKRIAIMAAMHLPLLFLLINFGPGNTYWFYSLWYIVTGVLITFAFTKVKTIMSLYFEGDIYPAGSPNSRGDEGQTLLDNKLEKTYKKAHVDYGNQKPHFNPYTDNTAILETRDLQRGNQQGSYLPPQQQAFPERRPPQS